MTAVQRALLSVSDKQGLVEFAEGLAKLKVQLLSSSGTAKALQAAGLAVREVAQLTGFPELLGGRVKTLHPAIHAGLLAKRDDAGQMEELKQHGLETVDLVAVNLYPFERTIQADSPIAEALEQIDIGGETLIRAAAKNFPAVVVLVDPKDYGPVLRQLETQGDVDIETRRALARKAFAHVTRYNAAITRYFDPGLLPQTWSMSEEKSRELRYGENPQQQSALYGGRIEQLHGKGLSYTNVLDLEVAWQTVGTQSRPATVIVKHVTPCGAALGRTLVLAFEHALAADEQSAFGGVIGLNRSLGAALAQRINERFFEAVIAPGFSTAALKILKTKKNLRLIQAPEHLPEVELRSTAFGWLTQTTSKKTPFRLHAVTKKAPNEAQRRDLKFAWHIVQQVKSNAIVLVKNEATVGIGAGQMSRVDAVQMALWKAGEQAKGAVLASDGFFPFPDGVELAAEAGIKAIVQPGGSVSDGEVIDAANARRIVMGFTGKRAFRH